MSEIETPEAGFVIDGREYPIPTLDTFDMDESMLLYDYSGLVLEDFASEEDEDEEVVAERTRKMKHPGFIKALMQIAYKRGNPAVSDSKAKAIIGRSNYIEALENLLKAEADASPPDLKKSEQTKSSDESSTSSLSISGDSSMNGSDAQDEIPSPTGTIELDTSPISPPISSVA